MTPSTSNLDWLYHLLGYSLAAAGLLLLLYSLFWDRSRGRRRCPKCWYDMAGVPGLTCPECGRAAPRESRLHRARRHWRVALLGFIVGPGGWALYLVPAVQRDGWRSVAPNVIIIACLPQSGSEWVWNPTTLSGVENRFSAEMSKRLAAGRIRDWELRWAFERVRLLRTRRVWSEDQTIRVGIWPPRWLDGLMTASPENPDLHKVEQLTGRSTSGTFAHVYEAEQQDQEVGRLRPGDHSITFQVNVEPGLMSAFRGGKQQRWRSRVNLSTSVVSAGLDTIHPVSDEDLVQAVRRAVQVDVSTWNGSSGPTGYRNLAVYIKRSGVPKLNGTAIGLVVDLLHGDQVVRTIHFREMTRANFTPPEEWRGVEPVQEFHTKALDPADIANWSVRVRGDRDASLREFDCNRYWNGQFTLPLSEVLTR